MYRLIGIVIVGAALAAFVGVADLGNPVSAQQKQDQKKDKDAPAKGAPGATFELYKDTANEFRFRLKNGDALLATSGKGYKTKEDCQKVIDTIKREAAKAKVDDQSKK